MRPLIACFLVCVLSQVGLAQQPVRSILQKFFGPNCNQQSQAWPDVRITDWSGYIVTGGRDVDGAVITSVEPIASQVPTVAPTLPPVAAKEPIGVNRRDFRQALLKAARQERGGSLTVGEYFAIFVGSLNPEKLEQAKLAVFDSGIQDGVIPAESSIGAIDWEKLIELIIKYLPMILALFSGK